MTIFIQGRIRQKLSVNKFISLYLYNRRLAYDGNVIEISKNEKLSEKVNSEVDIFVEKVIKYYNFL